jgi:release factor glutamine methyltransferase
MWLIRPPGVYRPRADTWLLAGALLAAEVPPGSRVLDVGTGTGALSVVAAQAGAGSVTAVDLSRRAVWAARVNTSVRGLAVRVVRGDVLAEGVGSGFDVVLANPPYVPSRAAAPPGRGAARAWDAGPDGRAVLDRLCAAAPRLLAPCGTLLLIHSALCDADLTLGRLDGAGLRTSVVGRTHIPFGPVMRGRADWLEQRGLIRPGQRYEELVVIRADRTAAAEPVGADLAQGAPADRTCLDAA